MPLIQNEFTIDGLYIHGAYSEESIRRTQNLKGFEGDIHLSTYPRTGTTWTQNILIGLWHGPDHLDSIGQSDMRYLFPYLEIYFIDEGLGLDIADKMQTRPRFLKNHLPAYLAPREIFTHKRKNIVVLRNPKDTALSYYKFYQSEPTLKNYNPADNLEGFLDSFLAGKVSYGSWWDWTKSWVDSAKTSDNTLIIHYEDLHDNFDENLKKMSSFLGLEDPDEAKLLALREKTGLNNMKARYEATSTEKDMIRKGGKGDWQNSMTPEMVKKFDNVTKKVFGEDPIVNKFL